ncbi:hypothetical protein EDD15DRAFT_2200986 [Pisolithus albus]|nr:hypothetical protein EDD15DRAFT_2200986 [Pisolithus albus]
MTRFGMAPAILLLRTGISDLTDDLHGHPPSLRWNPDIDFIAHTSQPPSTKLNLAGTERARLSRMRDMVEQTARSYLQKRWTGIEVYFRCHPIRKDFQNGPDSSWLSLARFNDPVRKQTCRMLRPFFPDHGRVGSRYNTPVIEPTGEFNPLRTPRSTPRTPSSDQQRPARSGCLHQPTYAWWRYKPVSKQTLAEDVFVPSGRRGGIPPGHRERITCICDAASFSYRRSDKGAQCCLGFGVNGAYFYVARLLPSWHIHESPGKKSVGTVVNHTFQKQKIDIGVIYFSQWDYEMSGPGVPNDGIG